MNFGLKELSGMDRAQVIELIKNNHEVMVEKFGLEEFLDLCIGKKYYTDQLDANYVKSDEDKKLLLDKMLSHKFTPSLEQLVRTFETADDTKNAQYIKEWKTLPFDVTHAISLANAKMSKSFKALWEVCEKAQLSDLLIPLANDPDLEQIIEDKLYAENGRVLAVALFDNYFEKDEESNYGNRFKTTIKSPKLAKIILSTKASNSYGYEGRNSLSVDESIDNMSWNELLDGANCFATNNRYKKYDKTLEKFSWEQLGRISPFLDDGTIPERSKLKHFFDDSFYNEDTIKVAHEAFYVKPEITIKVILLGTLEDIKKIERWPSSNQLRNVICGLDDEKASYIYDKVDQGTKAQLSKNYKIAQNQKVKDPSRKKSFFAEILAALKNGNFEEIRTITSSSAYTLEKFVEDSWQTSKGNDNLYSYRTKIKKCSKEEFMTLLEGNPYLQRMMIHSLEGASFKITKSDYNKIKSVAKDYASTSIVVKSFDEQAIKAYLTDHPEESESLLRFGSKEFSDSLLKFIVAIFINMKPDSKDSYGFSHEFIFGKDKATSSIKRLVKDKDLKRIAEGLLASNNDVVIEASLNDGTLIIDDEEIPKLLVTAHNHKNFLGRVKKSRPKLYKTIIEAYGDSPAKLKALVGESVRRQPDVLDELLADDRKSPEANNKRDEASVIGKIKRGSEIDSSQVDTLISLVKKGRIKPETPVSISNYGYNEILGKVVAGLPDFSLRINARNSEMLNKYCNKLLFSGQINDADLSAKTVHTLLKNNPGFVKISDHPYSDFISKMFNDKNFDMIADEILKFEPRNLELNDNGLKNFVKVLKFINFEDEADKFRLIYQLIDDGKGSLPNFALENEDFVAALSVYESTGKMSVKPSEEFKALSYKLIRNGANFGSLSAEDITLDEKINLLKMIEKIDPRYKELDLRSVNLNQVNIFYQYDVMIDLVARDLESLKKLTNVPAGLFGNKKLAKGISETMSLIGFKILKKAKAISDLLGENLDLSEVLDYSNQSEVVENEQFEKIDEEDVETILSHKKGDASILFKKMDKAKLLRFLRSCSEHGSSFLKDSIGMARRIKNGIAAISERIANGGLSKDELESLKNMESSVLQRLDEVTSMDTIAHMHDRLVTLAAFLKNEVSVPTGQDKYKTINSDKNFKKSFNEGLSLFFPKNRGEVDELGLIHGWCVHSHDSYFDGVVNEGNVLVAICNGEPGVKNAIALAYFEKEEGGLGYKMDQIRHSKLVGNTHDDASKNFNWKEILAAVNRANIALESKDKKAA